MDPTTIWTEFTRKLANGNLTEADCWAVDGVCFGLFVTEPAHTEFRDWILNQSMPEWEEGEDKLLFFADRGKPSEVRFDFYVRDGNWLFYTIDGITIPLKRTPDLPYSEFPSLSPWQEAFGRREGEVAFKLRTYLHIRDAESKENALAFLQDGSGMRACALAWVPYFEPRKAFIVLMGWLERRHYGEDAILEEFSDERCVLTLRKCMWLRLYDVATQFRKWMSREEYWEVFENIWSERAKTNEWNVAFEYDGHTVTMCFERPS